MELKGGYKLYFDRVDKTYYTKNRKYVIRPPLSDWLRSEMIPDSDLAITSFVLRTCNATMYVHIAVSFISVTRQFTSAYIGSYALEIARIGG